MLMPNGGPPLVVEFGERYEPLVVGGSGLYILYPWWMTTSLHSSMNSSSVSCPFAWFASVHRICKLLSVLSPPLEMGMI